MTVYYKGTEKEKLNICEYNVVNKILTIIVQFSVKPKLAFAVSKFGVFCCAYILVQCRGPPLNLLNLPQRKRFKGEIKMALIFYVIDKNGEYSSQDGKVKYRKLEGILL